jgi:hypothetical protein
MTINEAALREAMNYIKLHPEQWNQEDWACGTTACLAGTTLMLAHDLGLQEVARFPERVDLHGLAGSRKVGRRWVLMDGTARDGEDFPWDELAGEILGLEAWQQIDLFYCTQVSDGEGGVRHPTYEEFEARVSRITGVTFKDGVEL